MKNLSISVLVALFVSFPGITTLNFYKAPTKIYSAINLAHQQEIQSSMESRKRNFEIANNLLQRKGVPFDPEALLQEDWQETLAPLFAQMPEMQEVRYLARPLGGVELADTLYLPEKVQVTGDLVIVAKHLVFEGHDVLIKGNYNISIFPAENVTVMGDTLPRRLFKEDGKQRVMVKIPDIRPAPVRGNITIDTSGIGYKDWLEGIGGEGKLNTVLKALYSPKKRLREMAFREFESLRRGRTVRGGEISLQDETRDTSGEAGSIGTIGASGSIPDDPNPFVQPKATNGVCSNNIQNNGLTGNDGAPGGDAGDAGQGHPGNDGTPGIGGNYTVPDGDNNTWHFISHGGQGGKGGPGGFAHSGKPGGTGGAGGDGASCNCQQGGAGNGGRGGRGGLGGRAGGGGAGGKGGNGKNGGPITVSFPCNWSGSYDFNINPGGRGPAGDSSNAGNPGSAGDPGAGGAPGSNFNCSSTTGLSLGPGPAGSGGQAADGGGPGQLGDSGGNPGSFNPTVRSCQPCQQGNCSGFTRAEFESSHSHPYCPLSVDYCNPTRNPNTGCPSFGSYIYNWENQCLL